jgi:6-phosphogluconate dehydrogenase
VWRRGSVITSWLPDLTAIALARESGLDSFTGTVEDRGEARWTIIAAIEEAVPAEVLSAALYTRFRSRQCHTFAEKVLSAMRKGFGGHLEPGFTLARSKAIRGQAPSGYRFRDFGGISVGYR